VRSHSPIDLTVTTGTTLVEAIQAVFNEDYPEAQFQNLHLTLDFPTEPQEYPAILVSPNITRVYNAGLGHVEYFRDPEGNLRKWMHRGFEGSLDITLMTLNSSLDRDVLADSFLEMISFGKMDAQLNEFYWRVYGNPIDEYDQALARFQLGIGTDDISGGGNSTGPTPWQSEDDLVFSKRFSMPIMGGFYNAISESLNAYVRRIDMYAYINGVDDAAEFWVSEREYDDYGVVEGKGEASSE
jgi:hypothetical protein